MTSNSTPVLDKGFVTLLDHLGSDLTVVNAARVSFSKRSTWGQKNPIGGNVLELKDAKLIQFLATNEHWTPFGHPQLQLHMKMPIFCARQFMRSNVGVCYNEMSRRYVDSPPEFYEPKEWRARPDKSIKQGSAGVVPNVIDYAGEPCGGENTSHGHAVVIYNQLLEQGVAPEMARMVLPVSMYTEFWATMSLAACARIVKLRIDPHAQWEIVQYARAINDLVRPLFPVSWPALLGADPKAGPDVSSPAGTTFAG